MEVEAFDEKKFTEKKKGIGYGTAAFYGEHLFFNKEFKVKKMRLNSNIFRLDKILKQPY